MSDKAPDFFVSEPTPPEGEGRCDFCSSPDPQWEYPCKDYVHTENAEVVLLTDKLEFRNQGLNIEAHSIGSWAACPACHALIQRGDRNRLARRSAKRLMKNLPREMAQAWSLGNAIEHIRRIHDAFWSNRLGPPKRIEK